MNSSRRELLRSSAVFGGALLFSRFLAACATDLDAGAREGEEPVDESADALVSCKPPVISANHGHELVVSPADVAAARAKTYSIQGAAGHDHLVTITAAQFALLATGHAITVPSTNGAGHTHSVTVTCSVSSPPPPPPPPSSCNNGAKATAISNNHGHSLVVPQEDVAAATPKTYSIQGTSSHDHQVSLTAANFASLKAGGTIRVTSSAAFSHVHVVTVACA